MKQLAKPDKIREELKALFPKLDDMKNGLRAVLDEPADGSIGETQFNQLRAIQHAMQDLLLAQVFNTRGR